MIPDSISTRFSERYGVRYPIACAGMAFAGTCTELHAAVNAAGGIGAFGAGVVPPDAVQKAGLRIRDAGPGPLHLNFATPFCTDAHIEACEALEAEIVSFHWGHPTRPWIARLNAVGTDVWEQVGTADDAVRARDDGVAVVVAQGSESGGHNYARLPTFVAVPEIVRACDDTLILAAGGIVTGQGIAAALALGASGVWLGTRFAATRESNISPAYFEKVIAAKGEDTILTSLYGRDVPTFNPMRILRNPLVEEWEGKESEAPNDPASQPEIGTTVIGQQTIPLHLFSSWLPTRDATGDFDRMPMLAGQGVGLIDSIPSVADVVSDLVEDYARTVAALERSMPDERRTG